MKFYYVWVGRAFDRRNICRGKMVIFMKMFVLLFIIIQMLFKIREVKI